MKYWKVTLNVSEDLKDAHAALLNDAFESAPSYLGM